MTARNYDDVSLTPTTHHGWFREFCDIAWLACFIAGVAFYCAAQAWDKQPAYVLTVLSGLAFTFTTAVMCAKEHETDRRAYANAAILTGLVALIVAAIVGIA